MHQTSFLSPDQICPCALGLDWSPSHMMLVTNAFVSTLVPGMVETEFSVVRFRGDKDKADSVYKGLRPLDGSDIAETVVFVAGRPDHVNIAEMLVFPTNQAAATTVHRKP